MNKVRLLVAVGRQIQNASTYQFFANRKGEGTDFPI